MIVATKTSEETQQRRYTPTASLQSSSALRSPLRFLIAALLVWVGTYFIYIINIFSTLSARIPALSCCRAQLYLCMVITFSSFGHSHHQVGMVANPASRDQLDGPTGKKIVFSVSARA